MDFEQAFEQTKTKKHFEGYHNYYNAIIGSNKISSILEIGVGEGASLLSWKQIWPEAEIEGIDTIEPSVAIRRQFNIYALDSVNIPAAKLLNKKYDLVVDDGDQNWISKVRTLLNYYNKANKYYVIENLMGLHSLNKLFDKLPQLHLTEHYIFKSSGPRRSYSFRENNDKIIEKDTYPIIVFFKVENFMKHFINENQFKETMIATKKEDVMQGILETLEYSKYIKS